MYDDDLRCRLSNREVGSMCMQSVDSAAAAAAAAAALRFAASCLRAVRHRVPDGQICCCFIKSDPSDVFLKRDLFFMVPLGSTVSHVHPRLICTYSVITGMRGAKAGVSPPRRTPVA